MSRPKSIKVVAVGADFDLPGSLEAHAKPAFLFFLLQANQDDSNPIEMATTVFKRVVPDYIPTVFENSVTYCEHRGVKYSFDIWDTQGQGDYDRLRPLSYPNTQVFFCCFSLANRDTLDSLTEKLIPECRRYCPKAKILLIGLGPEERLRNPAKSISYEDAVNVGLKISADGYSEVSLVSHKGLLNVLKLAIDLSELSKAKKKSKFFFSFGKKKAATGRIVRPLSLASSGSLLDSKLSASLFKKYDLYCGAVDPELYEEQVALVKAGKVLGVTHTAFQLLPFIHEFDPNMKTRQVVSDHVKPHTYRHYFWYLLGRRDPSQDPFVSVATHFASHAWDYNYNNLTSALVNHAEHHYNNHLTFPYYWCDLFIKDQHNPAPSEQEFLSAISNTKHTVCILDTLEEKPAALGRIWCLYEYLHTISAKHELQVFLPGASLKAASSRASETVAQQLVDFGVDVRAAQASRPEDIQTIHKQVEKLVGFDEMEKVISKALFEGTVTACKQFELSNQLMARLTSSPNQE
eukprot:m.124960 g.124960  ORF g.124960 m.124960 type:complete len:519 (+) comp23439_c0_seq1:2-1558(+)